MSGLGRPQQHHVPPCTKVGSGRVALLPKLMVLKLMITECGRADIPRTTTACSL